MFHIKPKGTGETRIGTGAAAATLTTSGAHDLVLDTNSGTNSGTITITDGSDGNINIAPNGNGVVQAGGSAVKVAGKETIWVLSSSHVSEHNKWLCGLSTNRIVKWTRT